MLEALIGLVSAILGFGLREYINRLRPFFQLVEVDGDTRKVADRPDVSADLREQLSSSIIIKPLSASSNIDEVYDKRAETRRVLTSSTDLEELTNEVLSASHELAWYEALANLIAKRRFRDWMLRLLVNDTIKIDEKPRRRKIRVEYFDDDESGGCVWFVFPSRSVRFGNKLNSQVIRAKAQPFIDAVSLGERELVDSALAAYISVFEREREIATCCMSELNAIVNRNSRWVFVVYLANMNDVPLVVTDDPIARIKDVDGKSYSVACRLAYPRNDPKKGFIRRLRDLDHPLVVRPAGDEKFGLVTRGRQRDLENGDEIRQVFESGTGKVRIEIKVRTVGIRPNLSLKTPYSHFR